jgi:hypothetical protein
LGFDCACSTAASRGATEQRTRVEADTLHAALVQQAVEQALFVTFGEKGLVAHLHRHRHANFDRGSGKLAQPCRPN